MTNLFRKREGSYLQRGGRYLSPGGFIHKGGRKMASRAIAKDMRSKSALGRREFAAAQNTAGMHRQNRTVAFSFDGADAERAGNAPVPG
jgi:hypothetical protein